MKAGDQLVNESLPFSWKARCKSLGYAWTGIVCFFRREHNARLHLAAAVGVALLAVLLKTGKWECLALAFAIALVWITEMINTAIEKILDLVSPGWHPQVQFIKDVAAGAVLVAAFAAVVVGLIVFIPKIIF